VESTRQLVRVHPNHLHKPFDDLRVRGALWFAFNQEDFPKAVVGDPAYYKTCRQCSCVRPRLRPRRNGRPLTSNFEKARMLLREAGYDGTPVVLMHSTDLYNMTNLAPVAKQLMEKAGFSLMERYLKVCVPASASATDARRGPMCPCHGRRALGAASRGLATRRVMFERPADECVALHAFKPMVDAGAHKDKRTMPASSLALRAWRRPSPGDCCWHRFARLG
jgi:hypothetical protein